MSNEVTTFLKEYAKRKGYKVLSEQSGEILFADAGTCIGKETKIHLSSGSVYGFFAIKTKTSSESDLFKEVKRASTALDVEANIYPLYWGKDINPGSRIADHVRPRTKTGNAELEKIVALRKFRVVFTVIYVERYQQFEKELHDDFPPLVGSSIAGRQSIYTSVLF